MLQDCGGNRMKISVITVCYNDRERIEKTILSVLSQSYGNLEYIVIDGGSTDGTVDIIKKYANRIAYFVSESDEGIYDAMNKGLRKAVGEWVCFLNAGDLFVSESVLNTIFDEEFCRQFGVIYGDVFLRNSNNSLTFQPARPLSFLKRAMPFCHQSSFVRRDLIKGFNPRYKICADYDFFYFLFFDNPDYFCYIPVPISIYDNSQGLSVDNPRDHRRENLSIRSKHKDMRWVLDIIKYYVKYSVLRLAK